MKSFIKYIHEIFFLLDDDRKKLPWIILLFFISSFFDLAGLGLIGPYISLIVNPEIIVQSNISSFFKALGFPIDGNNIIIIISLALVIIFLSKAIIVIVIKRVIIHYSFDRQLKLQTYLMSAYQQLSYAVFLTRNSSEYVQTINGLVGRFTSGVLRQLLILLSEGIVGVVVICFLALTNGGALLLLIFLLGSTMFIYDRHFRRNLKLYGEKSDAGSKQVIKGIQESMTGFKEIRILGISPYFQQKVTEGAKTVRDMEIKTNLIGTAPRYLIEFILILFLVLLVGISLGLGKDLSSMGPTFGLFMMASLRLVPSATLLSGSLITFRYGRHATSRLYEDLQVIKKHDVVDKPNSQINVETSQNFQKLELIDLYFRYPKINNWALENVNLSIESGESIGLIGPSGAGKTTLLDILLGLLIPQRGKIQYNNGSLHDSIEDWRAQIAYLPQEIFLTDNTLRSNVAMGITESEIDDKKVHESLRQTRLEELVKQLPDGIDTFVGERGVRLSGGQRQRVALARAFYHERNILVMDEATSSLDYETERDIVQEIKNLKGKKTIIVIAHRLTTVEHCDRIYRLDQGRIVQTGTYDQVIGNEKINRT